MGYLQQADTMAVGSSETFKVTVTNNSAATLASSGSHPAYITYHWLGEKHDIVAWDNPRTMLQADIGPGEQGIVSFPVVAPGKPGPHILKVVMGEQDGLDFEATGQGPLHYNIQVR